MGLKVGESRRCMGDWAFGAGRLARDLRRLKELYGEGEA
jgi:hypothetical protein